MPWGTILDGKAGDETVVMIGQLPRNIRLKNERDELDPSEIVQPVYDRAMDKFDSELLSPGVDGHLEQLHWQDLSLSASAGGENLFEFLSANDSQSLASGDEDFEKIVSRLNRDGLDIVITFDSTGSMQGEIDQVKGQIQRLGSVLFELIRKTRIGICTYRDGGDAYVVQGHPLTDNLTEIVLYLEKISAAGGGDEPEAVDAGLQWACEQKFRRAARKVVLLFGDAPPRPNRSLVCQKISSDFRKQGGIVSTVTCRNSRRLDDFIKIAQSGGGEAFLTSHEQEIMAQLMVLVFGSQHRAKVIQAFDLLER
jgi:Mg-chelatase subunit ChlD